MEACVQAVALTDALRNEPQTLGETNLRDLCAATVQAEDH